MAHTDSSAASGSWRWHARTGHTGPLAVHGVHSPLVGRDAELEIMRQSVARAVDFQAPQMLTVAGNQGTGKSRLAVELVERHLPAGTRVYHGRAARNAPPYAAIGSLLRDRFGIRDGGEHTELAVHRLQAAVQEVFGADRIEEMLHFLGSFLDLHFPDSPFLRVLTEDRSQHEDIARTVLRRFLEVDAQRSPMVLVLDDLQWADDQTLALLQELGAGLSGAPVVIIACARPEMLMRCPEWGLDAGDHERVDLRNLEPAGAEAMFRHLLARCARVPDEVVEDAVQMTGGNPHFLTQLVRLFLANGTIDASGPAWRLDPQRAAETELPLSIEEAIEARIAALGADERDLLERGAVFGNVFWPSAVVSLMRIDAHDPTRPRGRARSRPAPPEPPANPPVNPPANPPVNGDLAYTWTSADDPVRARMEAVVADLVERDYLLQLDAEDSTIPGEVELVFKHNLERELIFKSTEAGRLARYHRVAAQWLETKLAGRSEEQLEFLGQLYERGGDLRRAAHCYLAGGDKARARYANQEAVELFTRGLGVLDEDDALARLAALHNLGDVLDRVGRTDEALSRFREMLRLAWLFDNSAKAGAAHGRLGRIYRRLGEYDEAMAHLRRAHELFRRAGDQRGIAATLDDMGKVHWLRGAGDEALSFYRQALELRRDLGDRRSIALSLANIGRVYRDAGRFKAAIAHFREALDLRRDIRDMSGMVQSLADLGGVHGDDGNQAMALELFEEAHGIALNIGDKLAQTEVLSRLGECMSAMGRGEEGVAHLRAALELATSLGNRVSLSACCRRLAEVNLRMGQVAAGYDEAKRALFISESVGSRVHMGNAHRVLGEAIAAGRFSPGEQEQAERHFLQAIEILSGIHSELDLARVYRAFAAFRERIGMVTEAAALRRRADEIYSRLRGAAAL